MQIKKLLILPLAVAIVLSSVACSGGSKIAYKAVENKVAEDDSSWITADETTQISLKNDKAILDFDAATTHFTVTDLVNNKVYASNFTGEGLGVFSEDDSNRMNSEITITYYAEQESAAYMFSTRDSVDNQSYKVTYNDDAIRVYYSFGATAESSFLPKVFEEGNYDALLEKLEESHVDGGAMARRMGRFYTLYTKDDATDEIKETYPAIKKNNLYIISDMCSESEQEEIREYMGLISYTMDSYADDLKDLGIQDDSVVEQPGFMVPVEYRLTEDGFTSTILSDLITQNNDTYQLQTVTMLEYFGSSLENNGKYFIPDGSGAIVDWNATHISAISMPFYGQDASVFNTEKITLSNDLNLPVFGISQQNGGVFAIVETGAEIGTLKLFNTDTSTTANRIYVDFAVKHMDSTDIGADMLIPVFNIFAKMRTAASPTIRYAFLPADKCEYDDMAKYYRDYLIKEGQLKKDAKGGTKLYIDYMGLITQKTSFLGIPYNKKITLSTLEEINKTVKTLEDKGVSNISLRLFGYTNSGLENKATNRFELTKKVGTAQQLAELEKSITNGGGKLYIDGDFSYVSKDGNGFKPKTDSSHYLNRVLVKNSVYNRVTRSYEHNTLSKYFVTAKKYLEYADSFISSMKKEVELDKYNISYSSAGKYLGGDYTPKANIDRALAVDYLQQTLAHASENTDNLAFDSGNAYVLPYADDILNAPLNYSGFDAETECVPFYQMVVHGYIDYAGQSVNLSYDSNEYMLRSLEYGAIPYYTMITENNTSITGTDFESLYFSLKDDAHIDDIVEMYKRVEPYYTAIQGQEMTAHEKLAAELYCTTYQNGSKIYVNYGSSDVEYNGISIKAKDFAFVG